MQVKESLWRIFWTNNLFFYLKLYLSLIYSHIFSSCFLSLFKEDCLTYEIKVEPILLFLFFFRTFFQLTSNTLTASLSFSLSLSLSYYHQNDTQINKTALLKVRLHYLALTSVLNSFLFLKFAIHFYQVNKIESYLTRSCSPFCWQYNLITKKGLNYAQITWLVEPVTCCFFRHLSTLITWKLNKKIKINSFNQVLFKLN